MLYDESQNREIKCLRVIARNIEVISTAQEMNAVTP